MNDSDLTEAHLAFHVPRHESWVMMNFYNNMRVSFHYGRGDGMPYEIVWYTWLVKDDEICYHGDAGDPGIRRFADHFQLAYQNYLADLILLS